MAKKSTIAIDNLEPVVHKGSNILYVLCAVLIIACAYQFHHTRLLQQKLSSLQSKLQNINSDHIREAEQTQETKYPHSHYEIELDAKLEPSDKYREYTYKDFRSIFHVEPLHKLEITQEVLDIIKGHDVKKDNFYVDNPEFVNYLIENYGDYIKQESLEKLDEFLLLIGTKW